ncbi:carbohydrate ABC transporter permease [Vreelandella sp. EE7]
MNHIKPLNILRTLLICLLVLFAGFPLYWMLNTALADSEQLYGSGQALLLNLMNLPELFLSLSDVPALGWLFNTFFIAAGTTVLSLALGALVGYALSRMQFRGRGSIGFLLFTTQVVPEALVVVPLYTMFISLGLLNSLFGLVLANVGFSLPVAAFVIKGAVDKVPYEIEESAAIDNCPRFGTFSLIVLPLIAPSLSAAAVISFFSGWNEFLFASTFLTDRDLWPASVGLASFIGQYETPLPTVMASALIFSVPAIVFFLLIQRRIVTGLTAGAVKG